VRDIADPAKCPKERSDLRRPAQVLLAQEKRAHTGLEESHSFEGVARNVEVLREHHPSAPCHLGEPIGVLRSRQEVIVVQLDGAAGASECICKLLASEAMVDEEDEIVWLVPTQRAAPGAPTGSLRVCP